METFWKRYDLLYEGPAKEALNCTERKFKMSYQPGDVVIVGNPKTGTTWLQQIFHQIRTKGDEDFSDIYLETRFIPYYFSEIPGYDPLAPQKAQPRVFKSHDQFQWIPKDNADKAKFIVIHRDYIDSTWSFMKFIVRHYGGFDEDLNPEGLQRILTGDTAKLTGSYFDFLLSWWPHRNDPNVLWIHFEDLKVDLQFCVQKISEFIGIPLSPKELATVLEHSSFDYMAKHKEKFNGEDAFMPVINVICQAEWTPQMGMIRPDGGKVGQGRAEMNEDVKAALKAYWDATIKAQLGFDDYQHFYEATSILQKC